MMLRQGNVFIPVCPSVHGGSGVYPNMQSHPYTTPSLYNTPCIPYPLYTSPSLHPSISRVLFTTPLYHTPYITHPLYHTPYITIPYTIPPLYNTVLYTIHLYHSPYTRPPPIPHLPSISPPSEMAIVAACGMHPTGMYIYFVKDQEHGFNFHQFILFITR